MKIILLLLFCHVAYPVKHSLKYFLTTSSGVLNFPEFVAVGMVDDVVGGHCDSNIKTPEVKQDWVEKLQLHEASLFEYYTDKCHIDHQLYKANINSLKQRFNQTEGVHTFQKMTGCALDDETGEVDGYVQYGYDGEDFLVFDMKTLTWIAPTPKAVFTKHQWDRNTAKNVRWKDFLTYVCIDHLKKFLDYGRSSLQRTVLPSISLLQKSPSSPVSCHATGFYPDRITLFWRKDGEEVEEGVEDREILPNPDGTFQKSVDLNVSSVRPEDWRMYECVFEISGLKEPKVFVLDPKMIRTNWVKTEDEDGGFPAAAVIGVVKQTQIYTLREKLGEFRSGL
ncbi:hypothetical protein LDENG_00235550 [Lucifuga dentata]|nr:hypothetical protein LDENG_00235550 [Lucifuga dentata]